MSATMPAELPSIDVTIEVSNIIAEISEDVVRATTSITTLTPLRIVEKGDPGAPGSSDHGLLTGLSDDDHTQYILASGTRAFIGVVAGIDPTADTHLATKLYVDDGDDFATGTFTITQSIGSNSNFTQNIILTNSNWTRGRLFLRNNSGGSTLTAGTVIDFTTKTSDSVGIGAEYSRDAAGGYYVESLRCVTNINSMNSRASSAFLGTAPTATNTACPIQVTSVRINSSNLEIIYRNITGFSATAAVQGRYFLFRGPLISA